MTRSFVPILLFIGSALASSPLLPRQTDLPACTKNCLVTYGQNSPCGKITDPTKFIDCFCKDNSAATDTLLTCIKSCPQAEAQGFVTQVEQICSGAGTGTGTGTPSASGSSTPTPVSGSASGTPSKTGTATSSTPTPTGTASYPCAEKCYTTYLGKTSCKPDDAECMCNDSSKEAQDLIACVKACPTADQKYFGQAVDELCNSGTTTSGSGTAGTTKTSGGSSGSATSTGSASTTVTKTTTKATTAPAATGNAAAPGATGSFVAMVGGLLAAVLAL